MATSTQTRFAIYCTADTEGNWCSESEGRAYPSREAAQAALDADLTAQPDPYGNQCYPEIVAIDEDGYDSQRRQLVKAAR